MGAITRGVKNAFRNSIRTLAVVVILAVSISMALVMLMSLKAVQSKIDSVKSSIGNTIAVSPAGIRGGEGGGDLLSDADASTVSGLPHVTKVVKTLSDRVTNGQDTNLQSSIDPGNFGNRQGNRQFQQFGGNTRSGATRTFTIPIPVIATSDLSALGTLNVTSFDIKSGAKFDEGSGDTVALVGTDLATKNNLNVDSTFQAYGKDVKVVGIFDAAGNRFANNTVVMPLKPLQDLSGQSGQVTAMTVQADSIDSVAGVASDIKSKLGNKADVVSAQDSSNQALAPLQNIKTISLYSLVGALVAGSVIIFLTMVMIVRERRREIGVLKAIGASNAVIVTQFMAESLVLTLISSVVGMALGLALSNPVLNVLVNNANPSGGGAQRGGAAAGQFVQRIGAGFGTGVQGSLRDLHASGGYQIILYGLLAAVVIALIGSIIPSYSIAKVRPAEVLRSE